MSETEVSKRLQSLDSEKGRFNGIFGNRGSPANTDLQHTLGHSVRLFGTCIGGA